MNAISKRPTIVQSLEQMAKTPPTQAGSSGDKIPPSVKPTYQGPSDDDQLRYTVPLVLGMQPKMYLLPEDYHTSQGEASQGKNGSLYHGKN